MHSHILGLTSIYGSMPATKCVEIVNNKLKQCELSLANDIICITIDGAAVMKKVGKLINADQQLCFAHGIHLAVIKVLYKKSVRQLNEDYIENETEVESDSESEDDADGLSIESQKKDILEINHFELAPIIK